MKRMSMWLFRASTSILLLLAVLVPFRAIPVMAWWDVGYLDRVVFSFNASTIGENLVNFPVLVHLTAARVDFSKIKAAGADIRFVDADDATPLKYEIELWDDVGEEAWVWVKIPQINMSSSYTDYFYMYYNNAAAVDDQDPANVWDANYVLVDHMQDGVDTSHTIDSTANNNDGAKTAADEPVEASGQIGYGQNYDGVNDNINVGAGGTLANVFSAGGTVEAIMYADSFPVAASNEPHIVGKNFWLFSATERDIRTYKKALIFYANWSGVDGTWQTNNNTILAGNWYHVAAAYNSSSDANDALFYISGSPSTVYEVSTPSIAYLDDTADSCYIGGNAAANRLWDGVIDEVRISNIIRSSDWVEASYMTTFDTLLYYGSDSPAPTVTTQAATGVTMDKDATTGGTFNGNLTDLGGQPSATVNFEYGLTVAYGSTTAGVVQAVTGAYTATIPATLTPGQTYHYRAKAVNGLGTGYGTDQTFVFTMPSGVATSTISGNNVSVTGTVSSMGVASDTYASIQYGTTTSLGSSTTETTVAGVGSSQWTIASPATDVTFYYRLAMRNGAVYSYSATYAQPTPSGVGGNMLKILLRVITAGVILAGVMVASRGGSGAMFISGVIGLLAYAIIDSLITMIG